MRLEMRTDADGSRSLTVETDDMVPGMEAQPWIDAWERAVQAQRSPLTDIELMTEADNLARQKI